MSAPGSLRALPAVRIIRAIADAAQRWADADFPPRVRATDAIAARTGYSVPVVDYALDRLFFPLSEQALNATIESEIGNLQALDGFAPAPGRPDRFARGLDRVCIIASRTTIGVALIPAIFALCAKCDVTVKDREDGFVRAFFETLSEEHEAFSSAAIAQEWHGADRLGELRTFDAVVAFGKDATLSAIRHACSPDARFIGFGNRASAGYVTRESLSNPECARLVAAGAARDLVLYDSEGCLSLHVLFVEAHDERAVRAFLSLLAVALEDATIEFPATAHNQGGFARTSHSRNAAAFRASAGRGAVFSDEAGSFALMYDPPSDEPPAFAPRALGIIPVRSPQEAVAYLQMHGIALEAFAISEPRNDVIEAAISAGAVRVASFGELQRPPVSGDHGGRPRIADFIRWIDKEI